MNYFIRPGAVVLGLMLIIVPNVTFASFDQNLSFGSRGSAVVSLQQFLISQNLLSSDSATGYFGRLTLAAVKAFQTQQRVSPVSGLFGPLTRAKANGFIGGIIQPGPGLKYLLFQLSNASPEIPVGNLAGIATKEEIGKSVDEIVTAIGQRGDHVNRQLGFTTGPLMFDHTDKQLRTLIADSFAVAEEKNVAVAFHIDDSMFWNRRQDLWSDKNNVEWSDWQGTIVPHRIIGWVLNSQPVLAPPMCYNAPAITAEATRIARDVIGPAIKKGVDHLNTIDKPYLFAGVMAGWETRMQDDSQPSVFYGYCALHNLGYSAANPPGDIDKTLQDVVKTWVTFWSKNLSDASISRDKIFTHIAVPSSRGDMPANVLRDYYKDSDFKVTTFNPYSYAGFSVAGMKPFPEIYATLATHGNPPWGVAEGSITDLPDVFHNPNTPIVAPQNMEQYLGGVFNHGGVFINIFGWDKSSTDSLGKAVTGASAIAAYQKFLQGQALAEKGVDGFSVQCSGTCVDVGQLGQYLPNSKVSVTTAAEIRAAGGTVNPTPGGGFHATVTGLSPAQASQLPWEEYVNVSR